MEIINTYLKEECERLKNEYPDIPEFHHPIINVSDTLNAYFALADYFTDPDANLNETMLIGVRSMDLLYSALGRQQASFGNYQKYDNPIDICSTLFFGIAKNHSFSDGNKRTALLVLLYQLGLYNYYPTASVKEFEKLVVATAANTLNTVFAKIWRKYKNTHDKEIKTIAHFLRRNTKRKDHTYHIKITMREMDTALTQHGTVSHVDGGKIHFERIIQAKWFRPKETVRYAVNFGGWTRSIGGSTARDILTNLKLYDQFPDYQTFINGEQSLYGYIQDFELPLLRLKDK